jgi:hypothetical protein
MFKRLDTKAIKEKVQKDTWSQAAEDESTISNFSNISSTLPPNSHSSVLDGGDIKTINKEAQPASQATAAAVDTRDSQSSGSGEGISTLPPGSHPSKTQFQRGTPAKVANPANLKGLELKISNFSNISSTVPSNCLRGSSDSAELPPDAAAPFIPKFSGNHLGRPPTHGDCIHFRPHRKYPETYIGDCTGNPSNGYRQQWPFNEARCAGFTQKRTGR